MRGREREKERETGRQGEEEGKSKALKKGINEGKGESCLFLLLSFWTQRRLVALFMEPAHATL